MKRLLKRTLSLILAMIMVMGVLPMNAMAAMVMGDPGDVRAETPVTDRSDPIANTHAVAGMGGEERPEIPVPGPSDEPPADPLWVNGEVTATINPDGSWTVKMSTADAATGSASNAWGIALVPNVSRGEGMTTPDKLAPTLHGGNVATYTGLANTIKGATGLTDDEFVIVGGGLSAALTTDADGFFTVTSADTGVTMPDVSTLATRFGVSAPIDVTVIFFTKGSQGTNTHVKYTQTTYGEPSKGLPHTVYVLNKGMNTLVYVSGTLEGEDWAPEGVAFGDQLFGEDAIGDGFGSWDEDYASLTIPVYNVTGEELTSVTYPAPTLPDGVTTGTLPSSIAVDTTRDIEFTIPESVESGTIVLPIAGTGDEGVYTGSITIYVDAGYIPITADPIDIYITKGDKSMETTPIEAAVTFHYPALYTTYSEDYGEFVTIEDPVFATFADAGTTEAEDFGLLIDDPTYSLETDFTITDYPDDDGCGIDITNTVLKIKLATYDAEFDDVTEDGTVLETTVGIYGTLLEMNYYVPGSGEVLIPVRIHVAVPEVDTYTVKFDTNSPGTKCTPNPASVADQPDLEAGATVDLTATLTDTQGHYTFKGWALTDNATSVLTSYDVDAGDADGSNVITLYAVWEELKYDVTYTWGGYTPAPAKAVPTEPKHMKDDTVTVDTTATATIEATNGGLYYTFKQWTTSDATIASGKFTMPNKAVTLTAEWDPVILNVTYDLDGGTAGTATGTTTVQKGGDYTIDADNPTKTGYTFGGWKLTAGTATTATGTVLNKSGKVQGVTANITLTAQWNVNQYTLSYDMKGHGTSQKPSDSNHNYNTTANLSATPAVNSKVTESGIHWVFKGWSATDGGTTAITTITMDDNKTVYAIWEKDTHTLTYNGNNGTLNSTAHATVSGIVCGASQTISNTDPTRAGFEFAGWNTAANGSGTPYAKGATISSVTSDITLYAQWTQLYTVKFDVNNVNVTGVTTPTSATGKKVGEKVTTSTLTDASGNYVFKGWAKSATGSVSVNGGSDYTVVAADAAAAADATSGEKVITFYAIWVKKTTVTYNTDTGAWATAPSGGTTTSWSGKGEPGVDSYNVPADPVREGYDFTGWKKTGASSVDTGKTANASISYPSSDETYTAQWGVKQYTVSFLWNTTAHSHTAEEVYKTTKGNYGTAITAPTPAPSMTGYTFGGWYKEAACNNAMTSADTYPANDELKMYAKWTPIDYTITYTDPQNGAASGMPSPLAQTAAYDSTHTLASAPTGKTGYVWDGWYDGNTKVTADFVVTNNRTLTAKWKITVSFDIHDPQATATLTNPADQVIAAGGTITLPTQADLTDYTFQGWFTAATGGNKKVSTDTYSVPTTLHAQWTAKTYTYTFNPNGGTFPNGTTNTSTSGAVGTAISAPSNDPTRTNYTFKGWATDNTNDTSKIITPATTMPSGGATVYAVWTANTYVYVFDPNGGAFGTGETGLQGDGTVKKTGAAGASVTAPSNPTLAKNRFDGWFTAKTGGNQVTTHTITGNAADGVVTNTVYAHWTPLYDVVYVNGDSGNQHGTVDTTKNDLSKPARTYSVLGGATVIPAGTGESWSGDYFTDAAGKHWKFNGWKASSDNKVYSAGANITVNQDITLTAQWDEYYLVTLAPPVLTDTATALGVHARAKFATSTLDSSYTEASRRVWVKAGDSMAIAELALKSDAANYIFAKWTQNQTGATAGTFANSGTQAAGNDTFTPKADTTLTPNYWRKPTLTAKDSYHQNKATGDAVTTAQWGSATNKKATNTLPAYTWTKNSAALATSDELQINIDGTWTTLNVANAAGTGVDVVKTVDASGNVTYTFQRDYLMTLKVPMGDTCRTYNIRVKSDTPDTTTTNHADTTLTAVLEIAVNPDPLTRVSIQVEDTTSATASVNDTNRDRVIYKDHTPTTIDKNNQLTYTWYYGPNKATQAPYNSASAANNATNVTNAKNNLPSGSVEITGVTGPQLDVTNAAYKGKYVYAVVVASNTGYGAVITNPIAVDYDAVVKVTKDGSASITGANYTVYLVPQPTTGSNAASYTAATLPATKVQATYQSANEYKTADSALTGGVTYDIYVNKVEGDTTLYMKTGRTVSTQTAAAAAPVVPFFSVNAVDTTVKHAKDSNSVEVGETFAAGDVPGIAFTTPGAGTATITVADGNGVYTGSVVTAKTVSDSWTQDYNVDWGKASTTLPAAGLTYTTTTDQTKTQAKDTGTTGHTVSAKTWIGAQLDQNVYTVTGNIWVNGSTKTGANIESTGNSVPTLTFTKDGTTYVFKANSVTANGGHNGNVTFTTKVPKSSVAAGAITGKYDITATPKANTTIIKYIPGQNLTSASDTSIAAVAALGGTNANTLSTDIAANNTQAFTVVLEASTYILNVKDTEATVHSATQSYTNTSTVNPPATNTSSGNFTTAPWTVDYAYTSDKTYTITVTNQGNTTLDVSLNILKATATTTDGANNGYIYGAKKDQSGDTATNLTAGGLDAYNGTSFGDLVESFTLAPAGTKTFTVTVPTGMDVKKTARYDFQFTSTEANTTGVYGPSVTYRLTETINPLKITDIQADNPSANTWAPKDLAIAGSTTIPTGVTVANEVEYKWYVAPKSTSNVAINKTGTGTLTGTGVRAATAAGVSGNNYTLQAADQGMSLYLVAHNKATGNVIEADFVKVADLPYDMDIIVKENTTNVAVANKGNYEVYLRPSTATGTFSTTETGVIKATADSTNPGVYTASNLVSGTTYKIYTNAVGGTKDNWQDSGETATLAKFLAGTKPEVVYRNVILSNTTVSNQQYNAAITSDTTNFLATYTGSAPYDTARTDALKAPTAKVGTTDVATTDVNKWVQSGTTVDLSYANWNRDYKLTWTGVTTGATVNTAPASGTVGGTGTVKVTAADTTVKTALELNLYGVTLTVDGPGTLSEVKMNDGTNDFTASAGNFHATGATTPPIGKGTYTFTVPKGTYTVLGTGGTGTDILYYKIPANSADTIAPADIGTKTVTVTNDTSSFHIQLNSVGQYMQVEDDQAPVDNATITAHSAGTAGWTGTAKTDGTAGSTVHLPYGYTAARTVKVTVANNSAENNNLYDVTWTPAATGNSASITAAYTDLDGSNNILYPFGGTVEDPLEATLTVATGLAVGTHTYTADVTFNTADDNATNQPKVTYTLTVVVDPAEFTDVSITKASGTAADIGTATVEFGESLLPFQYTTTTPNLWQDKGIAETTDYAYRWYATAANVTLAGTWANGNFTPSVTATALTPKAGTNELEGTTIANYPGQKIWLVVYATKAAGDGTNVIKAAISDPVTTGFQPVVKVSVDGTDQSTVSGFDGTGYIVTLSDGTTTYNTVWNATKGGFVPAKADGTEISLDATKEYTASANKYKGASGAAADLVAQTTKLSLTHNSITVPYFTVNAVEVKDYEAISGLGESVTVPTPTFTLGGATITSDVPVLKDQKVDAKMGNWTEDYKLTWYTKVTTTAPVPGNTPTVPGAYANTNPTMDKGVTQDVTAATGTGITNVAVSGKLYIGGRLDQNTYTITGKVVGATGSIAGVKVEQVGAGDSVVTTYVWPDNHSDKTNSGLSDGNGNGKLENNETVTFTVVKGDFTITSTPDGSTVIESVKWESEAAVDGNVLTKKNVAALSATNTKTAYNFEINVVGSSLSLSVTDAPTADGTAANDVTATSSVGVNGVGTNTVVRYFSYIDKKNTDSTASDVTSFPLVLENAGNMDLTVGLDVFYFDTTKKSVLNAAYYGTDGNWEGASRPNTPVFTAGSAATGSYDIAFATSSGETVLNLADVMKTGTVVPAGAKYNAAAANDTSVAAATLNLGEDAWSKDSGVFVFRFKGTSTAGTVVVYYVLDLTVEQLPIVGVDTQMKAADGTTALANTAMPGVGDKLQAKGFDATTDQSLNNVTVRLSQTATDTGDAATAKLTDDDVYFAWVSVPGTETANKATILSRFTVDANGKLVTSQSGYTVMDTNANAKEYTLTATDMDRNFYLIAYAPNTTAEQLKTNAKDKAISDVIKTKRTVGVQVSLDGNIQNIGNTQNPGYVIYLVEDGKTFDPDNTDGSTGTWATAWSNDNNKVYRAAIDLDNTTYRVYAPSFKGGSNYVDTGLTLGKQATGNPVEKVTVPYWSVEHTTNLTVENTHDGFAAYLPDSTKAGKADNQVQKALTVMVSDDRNVTTYTKGTVLTGANVPVLEAMNVKVTVDATKSSNNADTTGKVKKSWSDATDLHLMTTAGWASGTTATAQTGIAYPTADGDGNYLVQSGNIAVNGKKNFSAKLTQVLFDVTFVVKDNTPGTTDKEGRTPKVDSVTLKTDTTKESANGFTATASTIGNGTDGVKGSDGATVTFVNIPAGAFEVEAEGGERTIVDGYTWNAEGDALNNPVTPGAIVNVTSDPAVDKHAGNTIQIQYGSNAIRWFDNFDTTDGSQKKDSDGNDAFVPSSGFKKVDTANSGPFLALKEGYDAANGDVLTYKVRVTNTGANPLADFKITQNAASVTNLTADLTQVTVYDADGNAKPGTVNVTTNGFELAVGETVEFVVTIPDGKAASSSLYNSTFTVVSSNEGAVAGGNYNPSYQVKPVVEFTPGNALVIYGNNGFEPTPVDIAPTWDTDAYNPGFAYSVLTEDELADYLDGAARPANTYTKDGLTGGANKLPDWLVLNTATGAVTFDSNLYATDVNVQVNGATSFDNYTANEVNNEVVFYIKAVDQQTGAVYYTTYTVDVEPGQLEIVGGDGITLNGIAGQAVNKGDFVYDKVVNQATNDVVPAATAPATNTANGNDAASATSGKVFVTEDGNNVHTATWTVAAPTYVLGVDKHTFTVTYKPDTAAEKWNYKPATKEVPAIVVAPALSLDFADEIKNYDDVKDVLKLGEYSEVEKPEDYDPETATQAPEALAYTQETYRKGESITYLDEEPIYTVHVKKIGGLYNMSLTEDVENTKGFQVVDADGNPAELPKFTGGDQTLTFYVKLSEIEDGLWAGEHKIKFTAAGYTTDVEADQNDGNQRTATYELVFTVEPKTIPKAHVTGLTDPKWNEKPDKDITVTGENPTDPTEDVELDKWEDKHGNHPIKPPVVTITPEDDPYKPGEDYTTTVTLIPDPNYTFEDKTPEEEAPNYTAGGETPDDGYTVTVTPDPDPTKLNEKVEFVKTVPVPAHGLLKFDDKKMDEGAPTASDPATTGPEVNDKRGVIVISKGGKLGKYEINLGAYDNDITDITVTQTTNTLPAEGLVWALTPTAIDKLEKGGAKTTYTLDMTGVNTENLNSGTYTLQLTATGTDPNGRTVEASYTLAIQVSSPGGGGGPAPCPNQVSFLLGLYGTTNDPVMEMVANRGKVKNVPGVTAVDGYKFLGWSQSAPTGELEKDAKRELVDPQNVVIESDVTFYAVYAPNYRLGRPYHEHYVIGYPNGNFGPADNINRASVATIIARAVLPNFVEGADYGNPGEYSDVSDHWAASAIAYCSKYGVFQGYNDGTFRPDQSITRQELALVMARLSGVQTAQEMPFVDLDEAGDWAVDGIYTAYANGWVNGYVDGTFKPLDNIRRDETVKIFNAYLYRGVDEEGLDKLAEYVHSGVASNVTENGTSEYMTWPDVTKDQWAYYEIIEAANDHEYVQDTSLEKGYTLPETWDKCWIDEKWRYHDDLSDGGPTMGLLSAGFRVWTR